MIKKGLQNSYPTHLKILLADQIIISIMHNTLKCVCVHPVVDTLGKPRGRLKIKGNIRDFSNTTK